MVSPEASFGVPIFSPAIYGRVLLFVIPAKPVPPALHSPKGVGGLVRL